MQLDEVEALVRYHQTQINLLNVQMADAQTRMFKAEQNLKEAMIHFADLFNPSASQEEIDTALAKIKRLAGG